MMQTIAATAERLASDSIQNDHGIMKGIRRDSTMILQSIQREEARSQHYILKTAKPEAPVIQPVARRG